MIKPEKTRKIPENSEKPQKFSKKTLNFREKSPKNLPARFARGGSASREARGGIFQKKILRGYFGYTPPWPCLP